LSVGVSTLVERIKYLGTPAFSTSVRLTRV